MTTMPIPDALLAGQLAQAATGHAPTEVRRFPTGSQHYVFEAGFAARAPLVVRLTTPENRPLMVSAARLSAQLRPLGVPLPEIVGADLEAPCPYLLMERLPGTDLGDVITRLPSERLADIAARIAAAQRLVASLPSAGRYGYAPEPEAAPHPRWSDVIAASLERSRHRTLAAGLFDLAPLDAVTALARELEPELDAQPATPYLHDTTTKNVIVTPAGAFSGIVDVDDLCYGDPRQVVGLTAAALLVMQGPRAYIDAWIAAAGFQDDRLLALYTLVSLVDFMSEHGQVFNGNQRPSTLADRQRLLHLFGMTLRQATGRT